MVVAAATPRHPSRGLAGYHGQGEAWPQPPTRGPTGSIRRVLHNQPWEEPNLEVGSDSPAWRRKPEGCAQHLTGSGQLCRRCHRALAGKPVGHLNDAKTCAVPPACRQQRGRGAGPQQESTEAQRVVGWPVSHRFSASRCGREHTGPAGPLHLQPTPEDTAM